MKLKPIHNQVLLKRVTDDERTSGGLYVPPNDSGQDAWRAEVIAIGPGETLTASGQPVLRPVTCVRVGDQVFVPAFNGYKVRFQSTEYLLVKDHEIQAVIDRE